MSEFLMHQVGKQRDHPSDQTTLRTSLQVKDVNKILFWLPLHSSDAKDAQMAVKICISRQEHRCHLLSLCSEINT